MTSPPASLAARRHVFHAIASAVVPETADLSPEAWREFDRIVNDAVESRPPRTRRQLLLFLQLVELVPLVRYGHRFSRLNPPQRGSVLLWLQESPLLLFRRGAWALRTLVFMGFYARREARDSIGYRAHPDGWSRRQAANTPSLRSHDDSGLPHGTDHPPAAQ